MLKNFQKLSLVLFVVLIPYKILGIFQLEYFFRLAIGFLCLILSLKVLDELIPWFLNLILTQLLFFYFLALENYLREKPLWLQIYLCFCLGFNLGAWPSQFSDPTFWYLLIFFFLGFYTNMKRIFLNPEFEGNSYTLNKDIGNQILNWEEIHKNMNHISLALFKIPLNNQLGNSFNKKLFPEISKRYVGSRVSAAFRQHGDIIGLMTGFGGLLGFGISEYLSQKRHNESIEVSKEANRIAMQQVEEAKRANDLQERLLDSSTFPKPKSWLRCSEEKSFFYHLLEIYENIV